MFHIVTLSFISQDSEVSKLELVPRFPLFGGWKTGFYMGYNLPLANYIFTDASDSSRFVLNITFASDFEDVVVDDLAVRVILPEGMSDDDDGRRRLVSMSTQMTFVPCTIFF
jgi:oligosaccharyltransferase complex subunit alpha (ribophorin I)